MSFFDVVVLSIVEGITEFLPVSSTGHLILSSKLMGLSQTEFLKSFEISIQLGAILSVVALYWKSLAKDAEVLKKVIAAFLPTAIIGFLLYKSIKKFLLGNSGVVLWALLIGGVLIILFEAANRKKEGTLGEIRLLSYPQALAIGVFQSFAVVPGVSRSAATIIGGLLLGLKRKTIVEFSFLLAVPTMAAAAGLDLLKTGFTFTREEWGFLTAGFTLSFIAAFLAIRFLLSFIKRNSFMLFGVYRIILALLLWRLL